MQKPEFNFRTAEKFVIRLPDGTSKAIKDLAVANHSSMNTEMVLALEAHLETSPAKSCCSIPCRHR